MFYEWNVRSINIYPFGGVIKYEGVIDKPFKEELLVSIMGPIFQVILYIIIYLLNKNYLVSNYFFNIFRNYHYAMIFLNIIPIIPLDGSKVINILLNKVFSFQVSYKLLLFISIMFTILLILYINSYSVIFVIGFIITELFNYIKNKSFIYNRFIYERYLYPNNYKKYKKVDSIKNMFRNKKNLIKYKNIYITEKEAIKKEYNS